MIIPWKEHVSNEALCALTKLWTVYRAADIPLRFVGGCVRDWVSGRTPVDFDFATPIPPLQNVALLKAAGVKVKQTGVAHGTITAIIHGYPFEITTLRQDQQTDGRRAVVTYDASWQEDAGRRDLTINGLYMDETGMVLDLVGGLTDCQAGLIRFIGDPAARIEEDYLRILRLYRFFAHYGRAPLDEPTRRAVQQHAPGVKGLSTERVYKELMALLRAPILTPTIHMMVEDGVWSALNLPSIQNQYLPRIDNLAAYTPLSSLEKLVMMVGVENALALQPLCLSKTDRLFLTRCAENPRPSMRHAVYFYGVEMAQVLQRMADLENNQTTEQILEAQSLIMPLPPCPLTAADIQKIYPALEGKELGDVLRACQAWWLTQTPLPTQQECLEWLKKQ